MIKQREIAVEVLDGLAADDPDAMRSRDDLRRLHRVMGTPTILRRQLQAMAPLPHDSTPWRVLEIGAGDGSLMLSVAGALMPPWKPVDLTMLDRLALVRDDTIQQFAALGWTTDVLVLDVMDWAHAAVDARQESSAMHWDLIIANLFLHHFVDGELSLLMAAIARRAERFVACEPRRSWLPVIGSRMVGAIGANAVTRTDAVLSVKAGFSGHELTTLWNRSISADQWQLHEYSAGLFSHCFQAKRQSVDP